MGINLYKMIKYIKSMKIYFNSLKNKLIGIKVDINQVYMEFKEYYKGKIDWTEKHSKKILNWFGRKQFLSIYRYSRKTVPQLTKWTLLVLLNGGGLFVASTSIFAPVHYLHQIFGYGLSLYIGSKIVKKTWNAYVVGKIAISVGVPEVKEVENDMGQR